MRGISERNILDSFCIDFCDVVERHTEYIVVSGFVAISTGRTRATEDIDMIVPRLTQKTFFELHDDLLRHGFVAMQGEDPKTLFGHLNENLSLRYTRKDHFLPEMELKFAKDELDEEQLRGKVKIPLTGLDLWFSDVSTNIAFKEHYLKSDKDLEDARHLRIVLAEQVDESRIRKIEMLIDKYRMR